MRERRPDDWRVDLAERHPLEAEVAAAIDAHHALVRLGTSTASLERLDYQLLGPGDRLCELELKAKRRPYQGWSALRPDVEPVDLSSWMSWPSGASSTPAATASSWFGTSRAPAGHCGARPSWCWPTRSAPPVGSPPMHRG